MCFQIMHIVSKFQFFIHISNVVKLKNKIQNFKRGEKREKRACFCNFFNVGFQRSYRAMYDYDADDDDEVSFRDGDVIVDCKPIDEGWMMGTVLRTGRSGMVPANYIEPIH